MYLQYFGNKFEIGALEKIASKVNKSFELRDRMDFGADYAETGFEEAIAGKDYLFASKAINREHNVTSYIVPEHRVIDVHNGLLETYIIQKHDNTQPYSKDPNVRDINTLGRIVENLGYIPPKLEMAFFLTEPKQFIDNNKFTGAAPSALNFLQKPEMIEVFKKEMEECFENLNESYSKKNLKTVFSDILQLGSNEIATTKDDRIKMVNKFMELSILIDEHGLSNTSMKEKCLGHLAEHMKNINEAVSGKDSSVKAHFLQGVGLEGFEKVQKLGYDFKLFEPTEEDKNKLNIVEKIKKMHDQAYFKTEKSLRI